MTLLMQIKYSQLNSKYIGMAGDLIYLNKNAANFLWGDHVATCSPSHIFSHSPRAWSQNLILL